SPRPRASPRPGFAPPVGFDCVAPPTHPTATERAPRDRKGRRNEVGVTVEGMDDAHSTAGSYVAPGQEFTRDTNYITTRITRDGADGYPVEAGRYRLVAARACPWANRTIIVRRLLGLEDAISLG